MTHLSKFCNLSGNNQRGANEQWLRVEPLIPASRCKPNGRGRPPRNSRDILNGILWHILERKEFIPVAALPQIEMIVLNY
ncbi:MAG: transposase [Nitrospirae bacterium]|nr:MAG: transposase [Nitrospirota bacterium]